MDKAKRKSLIRQLNQATKVSVEGFELALKSKAMSDEDLVRLVEHIEICKLIKPAVTRNRYIQGKRTEAANNETKKVRSELEGLRLRLRDFANPDNSEILKAGRWLMRSLSLTGSERQTALAERELVHQTDHDTAVSDLLGVAEEVQHELESIADEGQSKIESLESRNDRLRSQMQIAKDAIVRRYGRREWNDIKRLFGDEAA